MKINGVGKQVKIEEETEGQRYSENLCKEMK